MAAEYLPRLFQAFSQEDPSMTRRFEGSGLGLALVKRYAEMNGAHVTASSRKGHGSTFVIEFSAECELPPEARADSPAAGRDRVPTVPAEVAVARGR